MEGMMKWFKPSGVLIVAAGCLVSTVGFAMAEELPVQQSAEVRSAEVPKDIHTNSPASSASLYKNVEGTLKDIQGDVYVLEGGAPDQSIQIHVGKDTAFPNGKKKPGQLVQALVSAKDGHALIIR
jgi:hypothetical protein